LGASVVGFADASIDFRALMIFSIFEPEPYVPYSFSNSSLRRILAANKDMVFCIRTIALWRNIRGVPSSGHVERIQPCLNSIQVLTKFVVVTALGQSLQTRLKVEDATTRRLGRDSSYSFQRGLAWSVFRMLYRRPEVLPDISQGHSLRNGFRDRKVVHITTSMSEDLSPAGG
jgi:hypothetical protein